MNVPQIIELFSSPGCVNDWKYQVNVLFSFGVTCPRHCERLGSNCARLMASHLLLMCPHTIGHSRLSLQSAVVCKYTHEKSLRHSNRQQVSTHDYVRRRYSNIGFGGGRANQVKGRKTGCKSCSWIQVTFDNINFSCSRNCLSVCMRVRELRRAIIG